MNSCEVPSGNSFIKKGSIVSYLFIFLSPSLTFDFFYSQLFSEIDIEDSNNHFLTANTVALNNKFRSTEYILCTS